MSKPMAQIRDYNFFSSSFDVLTSSRTKVIWGILIFVVLSMIITGSYFFLRWVTDAIELQIATQDSFLQSPDTLEKRQIVQKTRQELDKLTRHMQAVTKIQNDLAAIATINSEYIQQVNATVPAELFFENISMTNNQLQIQGSATTRLQIAEFLNNMEASDLFKSVHISSIVKSSSNVESSETDPQYTFILSCILKDVMTE